MDPKGKALVCVGFLVLAACASVAQATAGLSQDDEKTIAEMVGEVLAATGAPSASIAVVKNGQIAYTHAFGEANIERQTAAAPEMRYCIGSISKQFTAAAILMLAEQGKLSLQDFVSKYVSGLSRGDEVTIRELLSMTSGYPDFWPQDYVMPMMMKPTTPEFILDHWARVPLTFTPGTDNQYSNTNYVIAGLILEKTSGMTLSEFLRKNVFIPLHMQSVTSMPVAKDTPTDPVGYLKYALGPPRPAPKEGKGWMFAAGELAMTASDLARWDISMMEQSVLKPTSYKQMETEVLLANGVGTNYGLGVNVGTQQGHRTISHGGEVAGFVSQNILFPDDRAAVVVLTNLDASTAARQIAGKIIPLLFPVVEQDKEKRLQLVRKVFLGLQEGELDRSLLTENCNSYFSGQAIKDFAASLGVLGSPQDFKQSARGTRGGMEFRSYTVKFSSGKTVRVTTYWMPDGKLEQYLVMAAE